MNAAEMLSFDCPRCQQGVEERLYGPCTSCRGAMREAVTGAKQAVEAVEYEPKMNVVPNQVATKE